MANKKGSKMLSKDDRNRMKSLLEDGYNKVEIAQIIGCSRSTLYNELQRGNVDGKYNPDYAQSLIDNNLKKRGTVRKIDGDNEMMAHISDLILNEHYIRLR